MLTNFSIKNVAYAVFFYVIECNISIFIYFGLNFQEVWLS